MPIDEMAKTPPGEVDVRREENEIQGLMKAVTKWEMSTHYLHALPGDSGDIGRLKQEDDAAEIEYKRVQLLQDLQRELPTIEMTQMKLASQLDALKASLNLSRLKSRGSVSAAGCGFAARGMT